ncbi:hypothetical protein BJY01DRAFT_252965 [Aspergillus pseudoustus]|uniref:Uncharacterized protein n=1 Tax=Aspergillus pseudoustus TaxID=1810923 RepID=A0ABR4J528_9EURO
MTGMLAGLSCEDLDDMDVYMILRKLDKDGNALLNFNIPFEHQVAGITGEGYPRRQHLQLSQPDSIPHSSNTPTEPPITLRHRHTQQTSSTQERHDPVDSGANGPSGASKAWVFFVEKVIPISGFLGLVLVFAFGVGAWAGMNYANSYAKKQYDIALFGACHDYKVGLWQTHLQPQF